MKLDFVTVDVFTTTRFAGNPLAVVLNAEGLTEGQMQAIAAEFNLAETVFVLPPQDPTNTARIRIFTPRAEMAFAGHPNVGAAFALAREGVSYGRAVEGATILFEQKAGLVRLDLTGAGKATEAARLRSPKPLALGDAVPVADVAAAAGLPPDDVDTSAHPPRIAGCGTAFVFARLRSRRALAAARPVEQVFAERLLRESVTGLLLYVPATDGGVDLQARMFAPLHGIPEDPATGSAAVALIGLLASLEAAPDLRLSRRIGQAFDMGRPSVLAAEAVKAGDVVAETYVGGACVPVMRGTLSL